MWGDPREGQRWRDTERQTDGQREIGEDECEEESNNSSTMLN